MAELKTMKDEALLNYLKGNNVPHSVDPVDGWIVVHNKKKIVLQGYDIYDFQKLKELGDCEVYTSSVHSKDVTEERKKQFAFNTPNLVKIGDFKSGSVQHVDFSSLEEGKIFDMHDLPEFVAPKLKKADKFYFTKAKKLHVNALVEVDTINAGFVEDFSADSIQDIHGPVYLSGKLRGQFKNGIYFREDQESLNNPNVSTMYFSNSGKVKLSSRLMMTSSDYNYPMVSLEQAPEAIKAFRDELLNVNLSPQSSTYHGRKLIHGPLKENSKRIKTYTQVIDTYKDNREALSIDLEVFDFFESSLKTVLGKNSISTEAFKENFENNNKIVRSVTPYKKTKI